MITDPFKVAPKNGSLFLNEWIEILNKITTKGLVNQDTLLTVSEFAGKTLHELLRLEQNYKMALLRLVVVCHRCSSEENCDCEKFIQVVDEGYVSVL